MKTLVELEAEYVSAREKIREVEEQVYFYHTDLCWSQAEQDQMVVRLLATGKFCIWREMVSVSGYHGYATQLVSPRNLWRDFDEFDNFTDAMENEIVPPTYYE